MSPVVAQMREEKSPVPVLMWAGKAPAVATISFRTAVRAVAAAEFHAQIEGCLSAQAQRSCERGERGDGA